MAIKTSNVTTVATSVYTSTGNSATTVIHFCNYSASTAYANIWVVQSSFAANNFNMVYSNIAITGTNTVVIDTEKLILGNGDAVYANASANLSVGATVSYIGI
jgi:hypothetical protein